MEHTSSFAHPPPFMLRGPLSLWCAGEVTRTPPHYIRRVSDENNPSVADIITVASLFTIVVSQW